MGPAATTTAHLLLFPAARLSARCRERQGRLTAPATPAGLRPVLDPPVRSPKIGSYRETGHAKVPGRASNRPAGQSSMPATAGNTGKRPVKTPLDTAPLLQGCKPRLTRPRSFRDDME